MIDQLRQKPPDQITLMDILNSIAEMRDGFDLRFRNIEEKIGQIDSIKEEIADIKEELNETKLVVSSLASAEEPFPSSVSVLITNLPAIENEDNDALTQGVEELFADGLEMDDTEFEVLDVQRIPPRSYANVAAEGTAPRDRRPGLVKVRLGAVSQKIACLRNKMKLKSTEPYKHVYIRGCEDHASRLNRLNMETLLVELGKRDIFTFTGSGRMVPKETPEPQLTAGNGQQQRVDQGPSHGINTRNRGRGGTVHGRGSRGGSRGGPRGRGGERR